MTKRTWTLAGLGVALAATLGAGLWYYSYRQSPAYSLDQLQKAVEEGNTLKAEQYADLERFSQAFVEDVLSVGVHESLADMDGENGWAALGRALGMGMIEQLKAPASQMMASALREAIETGQADSVFRAASARQGRVQMSALVSTAGIEPEGFLGTTEIQQEGNVATVGLRFRNVAYDTTLTFRLKLERVEDRWRVTEPYQLDRLLQTLSARKERLLAAANAVIQAEADSLLEIGQLRRWTSSRCSYCRTRVHLAVEVTNRSPWRLGVVQLAPWAYGEPLDLEDYSSMTNSQPLEPGDSETLNMVVNYNQFLDAHETLRYGTVEPRVKLIYVSTDSTYRTVHPLESLGDLRRFQERETGPGILLF